MRKADCFRLGDLYGRMEAGWDQMRRGANDREFGKFRDGAYEVWSNAKDVLAGLLPGDKVAAKVRDLADSLNSATLAIEQGTSGPSMAEVEEGLRALSDLIDYGKARAKGLCD